MSGKSSSPPLKRIKLEPTSSSSLQKLVFETDDVEASNEDNEHQCSICLQDIVDRTVIPTCFHEFCFECITMWAEQSRRCPLCSQSLGDYLLHNIRSKYDFRKHHLAPLRKSPAPVPGPSIEFSTRPRRSARERQRERRLREEREASDKLARSIEKRRWVYRRNLYAKHVASNSFTRYRPYPTPAQFASSNDLISRTTIFLRRELQVWDHVDIEFLTTFTLSLMKSVDIRSEVAVKLLAEFLDMDVPYEIGGRYVNAEHFAHEVYSFVRSPFRDLFVYDSVVQYDVGDEDPQPEPRGRRWARFRSRSRSRSRSSSRSPSRGTPYRRDRSISYSPSGRYYPSSREAQSTSYGSTSRRSQVPETDQSRSSGSEELLKNTSTPHVDGRYGTSRIEGQSHMGIEGDGQGERFACETPPAAEEAHSEGRSLPAAAPEIEVAQTTTIPAQIPPRPPPTVKPGHRSLAQSVRAHLQRATKDQQPGPSTNHGRSERHRNSAPILRDPTSPSATTLPLRGNAASTDTQDVSKSNTTVYPDPVSVVNADETQSGSSTLREPQPRPVTRPPSKTQSTSANPNPSPLRPSLRCADARTRGKFPPLLHSAFTEACAPSNGATTSATPYASQPPFHVLDSENIPHYEVTSRTKTDQMEISSSVKSQDTSVSQTFLSMSTPTIISDGGDDDENHHHRSSASSSTHPREILLAKLEREKTHAKLEGAVVLRCCAADTSDAKEIITSAAESPRQRIQLPDTTRMQDAIVMDPHAREIKLKKRAQLQARLAAEKRK